MEGYDRGRNRDFVKKINEIKASDLPEVEKMAQAFDWITSRYVENGRHEVELVLGSRIPYLVTPDGSAAVIADSARAEVVR